MAAHALPLSDRLRPRRLRQFAHRLADGATTTVYVASHPRKSTRLKVAVVDPAQPLRAFCRRTSVLDALVGGFYVRPGGTPLGDLVIDGVACMTVPFDSPWDQQRSCIAINGSDIRIAPRALLPAQPEGDLLQAGPLLVAEGKAIVVEGADPEGFSAGAAQFDSDITVGRYPRAALGITRERLLAVVCDGRSWKDEGLTLAELAELMVQLGSETAINLDGGGSASLVCHGKLVNRPRETHGVPLLGGRPVSSSLIFARG